jgi:predicted nucleic acid binding AN1-type Zn finger protein
MNLGQNNTVFKSQAVASPEITGITGTSPAILILSSSELDRKTTQTKRCGVCSKKTGLTGFQCRCGALYCGLHRYPEEHSCTFDYAAEDRKILTKHLMVGKLSEKVEKI